MRISQRRTVGLWVVGLLGILAGNPASAQQSPPAGARQKIHSLGELPRHVYKIEGSVSALLEDDAAFAAFARQVRRDLEADLARFEIDDAATLRSYYGSLLSLDMLEGRYDAALARIEQIRALEDKPAKKLMAGLTTRALIAALRESGQPPEAAATRQAFARHLAELLGKLPWQVVADEIKQAKGRAEIYSRQLVLGIVQSRIDPIAARSGEISGDIARQVVSMRFVLKCRLPLKTELIEVYQRAIDAHQVKKVDIWPERAVTLTPQTRARPVVIGIWDSGLDVSVFDGRLWTNPKEQPNGKDDDNNDYVDDLHGLGFDLDANYTPRLLAPADEIDGRLSDTMRYLAGFTDLQAAIDSPAASAVKRHLAGLKPGDIRQFIEDIGFCGTYAHGTHVAGIAVEGNPFARVLAVRITFDHHMIPKPLSVPLARRHARSYLEATEYFRQANARVVNMSWGWSLKEIESGLEANNVGRTAEERAALAQRILGMLRQGLYDSIKRTPEVLYVAAAGNSDDDVEFDQMIPSSFELPNLLIVGAVDQAGEPTSFTSYGKTVQVYANGFQVESCVPGGGRMKMSGTSMAAPNVTNLAAKLFALRPMLDPEEVIDLIKRGADRKEGDHAYLLLNPRRSVELLCREYRLKPFARQAD